MDTNEKHGKKLDRNYTSWKQHFTKQLLFGHLPPISILIHVRRTRYAGQCWRSNAELKSDVFLWTTTHRHKLSPFWSIRFCLLSCKLQLGTVKQCSTLTQFGNCMLYCLLFSPEAPIRRLQSVWQLIWEQCREFENSWKSSMLIPKVQPLGSFTLIILIKKNSRIRC